MTTKFIRQQGDTDTFRYPHPQVVGMDEVAEDMGPQGICGECGHYALRHSRLGCRYHELDTEKVPPCQCRGMQWGGARYYMDPAHGPIRTAGRGE